MKTKQKKKKQFGKEWVYEQLKNLGGSHGIRTPLQSYNFGRELNVAEKTTMAELFDNGYVFSDRITSTMNLILIGKKGEDNVYYGLPSWVANRYYYQGNL